MSYSPISSFTSATDTNITSSSDKFLIFNTSGTVIFNSDTICKVLLVGGGGAGGVGSINEGGGGGGGGGVGIGIIKFIANTTYTITVGNGKLASGTSSNNDSSIVGTNINEVAYSGGNGSYLTGFDGGSGGGGSGHGGAKWGGKATMGVSNSSNDNASIIYYGNAGGYSKQVGGASGGGGAQNMGNNVDSGAAGVTGGNGIIWTENNNYYGAGGGGGGSYGAVGGNGGTGGGGKGGNSYAGVGSNATANTGGGGGGGGGGNGGGLGGSGGSGIVIIRYVMHNNNAQTNNTILLSAIRNLFSLTGVFTLNNLRAKSANNASSQVQLSSYLTSKLFKGITTSNCGKNALEIKNTTGTTTDGTYYIMCNNVPTSIYCLMNNQYSGGGWMLIMKSTTSATFNYEANYWNTINTLNNTDLTRANADAKYDAFNYIPIKDVMAIWPAADFGFTGGSFTVSDGWTWLVTNWYNNGSYVKAIDGFNYPPRDASPSNPTSFAGFKSGVFSTQSPASRHVFGGHSHIGGGNNNWGTVKWGFVWNENAVNNFGSCDAWNGIGVSRAFGAFGNTGKSAGDNFGCCGTVGYNRAMRIELYGR